MIDFKSTMKMAINSLKVNKLRSALTSLGIIIGVILIFIVRWLVKWWQKKLAEGGIVHD